MAATLSLYNNFLVGARWMGNQNCHFFEDSNFSGGCNNAPLSQTRGKEGRFQECT